MKLTQKDRDNLYGIILDWLYLNTYALCIKQYCYSYDEDGARIFNANIRGYVIEFSGLYVREIIRENGILKTKFGECIYSLRNYISYTGYDYSSEKQKDGIRNLRDSKNKLLFEEYEGCELTTLHDYYRNCKDYYMNHLESPLIYPIHNMRIGIHI